MTNCATIYALVGALVAFSLFLIILVAVRHFNRICGECFSMTAHLVEWQADFRRSYCRVPSNSGEEEGQEMEVRFQNASGDREVRASFFFGRGNDNNNSIRIFFPG